MGVELPLCEVLTILECCVTFSGVKLSIRSFVLLRLAHTLFRRLGSMGDDQHNKQFHFMKIYVS